MLKLTQDFIACPDDACRAKVQSTIAGIAKQLGDAAAAQAGQQQPNGQTGAQSALPSPTIVDLPHAGAIDPDGGRWRLTMETTWTTTGSGIRVRSHVAGEITLEADRDGVLTGSGPLQAEVIVSDVPGCQSEPETGTAEVELGGLIDGDFIWLWVVPRDPIRTLGTTVCTIMGHRTTHENETVLWPAAEFILNTPVLFENGPGSERYSTGNTNGTIGAAAGVLGDWERVLRLSRVVAPRKPPLPAPARDGAEWLLEHRMVQDGYQHQGEAAFLVPLDDDAENSRVLGIGPLDVESTGATAAGRLILDGRSDGKSLHFIPRAVLDDVKENNVAQQNLGMRFFDVLFQDGDRHVTLPLKDGATLKQGPVTWRLRGPSKCKLTITGPKQNERFLYSSDANAFLGMTFTAKVTPAKFAKDITWDIPKLGAGNVAKIPNNGKGPKLVVDAVGLPQQNSFFGPKQFVAKIRTKECFATAERTVRLFFPRDATNNPSKDPNWFYFWSQTGARVGPAPRYSPNDSHCGTPKEAYSDTAGFYEYTFKVGYPQKKYYHFCDLTKFGPSMPFEMYIWKFKVVERNKSGESTKITLVKEGKTSISGIDTFALTSRHENQHLSNARRWWMKPDGTAYGRNERPDDIDGDGIPRKVEIDLSQKYDAELGPLPKGGSFNVFHPGNYKTNGFKDEELYTRMIVNPAFKTGKHDSEDWAYPGKQWKK